jgi:hypothetical protein
MMKDKEDRRVLQISHGPPLAAPAKTLDMGFYNQYAGRKQGGQRKGPHNGYWCFLPLSGVTVVIGLKGGKFHPR